MTTTSATAAATDDELARTLRSLKSTLARQVRDMAGDRMEAWLWGVLVGWDDESMSNIAERFGWSQTDVAELQRLRRSIVEVTAVPRAAGAELTRLAKLWLRARNAGG